MKTYNVKIKVTTEKTLQIEANNPEEATNKALGTEHVIQVDAVEEALYIVRSYDKYDHQWMDVSKPVTEEEAQKIWNKETSNGTKNTNYNDGYYYEVFPADTRMLYSDGFGEI